MTAWWSQKFAAEGAASAEGISRQLGKPAADPLTILVREAAQNSWDARERDQVRFSLNLRRLESSAAAWRQALLPGPADEAKLHVGQAITPDSYVLVISDRGTRGLGGPLRADVRARPGDTPDFVQFLRNVGEASDQRHGGGTYGFGKGILYSCSLISSILVDTHAYHGDVQPRRLMGAALGPSFYSGDTRYTGRHWWGVEAVDGIVDPVGGDEAATISRRLGLPGFADGEFGTDIAILGFRVGDGGGDDALPRTPMEAGEYLASSILWHLWPKMGSRNRPSAMAFDVVVDGVTIPIPDPDDVPELAPFVASLDKLAANEGACYQRTRAPRVAGFMAATVCVADPRFGQAPPAVVAAAMPFTGPARHFCRMRAPELVVDYLERTPHPDTQLGYGGVFKASPEADTCFSASEPPTHDDWVASGLSGSDKGVVQGLGRRLHEFIEGEFPRGATGLKVSVEGLGRLAGDMAGLIPRTTGTRASASAEHENQAPSRGGGRPGREQGPTKARILSDPRVMMLRQGPAVVADVIVPPSARPRQIVAEAGAVTVTGTTEGTDEAPLRAESPAIERWEGPDGRSVAGDVLEGADDITGQWRLIARHVPDAVIRLSIRTEV